jgi:hypothetical protein
LWRCTFKLNSNKEIPNSKLKEEIPNSEIPNSEIPNSNLRRRFQTLRLNFNIKIPKSKLGSYSFLN